MPEGSGFATNSRGGLSAFSNTFQVQFAPCPPSSKSMGAFCEKPIKVISKIKIVVSDFIIVILVYYKLVKVIF